MFKRPDTRFVRRAQHDTNDSGLLTVSAGTGAKEGPPGHGNTPGSRVPPTPPPVVPGSPIPPPGGSFPVGHTPQRMTT
jgi:hypothetical protein